MSISWALPICLDLDPKTRRLDNDILKFIRQYSVADEAPESVFQDLALKIFAYQYERNQFYRRFCAVENKTPLNVQTWKEIPAIPAEGFKEFILTTFPYRKAARLFRTSGTTHSGRGVHFFETLKLYEASLVPAFKKYLLPDHRHMDLFFLTASPRELRDSSLSYMMGVVQKKFGMPRKNNFYVKKENILSGRLAYDLLSSKKPVMILATAFSLKGFLNYLKEKKIALSLKPGSRLMETGGFKGRMKKISKRELYREVGKELGIPPGFCVSEYGMTELSSQYYDTTFHDGNFKAGQKLIKAGPAWLRALVIDPKTGKEAKMGGRGLLRHFDLANRGSVMAVQTADLAVRYPQGFEVIGRVPGASARGCSLTYEEFLKA